MLNQGVTCAFSSQTSLATKLKMMQRAIHIHA